MFFAYQKPLSQELGPIFISTVYENVYIRIAVFKILIWVLYIVGYMVENLILRQLLNVISGRVPDDIIVPL